MGYEEIWAKKLGTTISSYIGSGDFGEAFETEDGRVIKITTDVREACCSAKALNATVKTICPIHAVQKFSGGKYGIYMDFVEQTGDLEFAFSELEKIIRVTGYQYDEIDFDYLDDFPELVDFFPSNEAIALLDAINDYILESHRLGFIPEDIKFDNSGVDINGGIRFFDHLQRRDDLDDAHLMSILASKNKSCSLQTESEPSI